MADNPQKRGPQDRNKINLNEEYEVQYWSKKFGVTPEQLRELVQKVGNSVTDVERAVKRAA